MGAIAEKGWTYDQRIDALRVTKMKHTQVLVETDE